MTMQKELNKGNLRSSAVITSGSFMHTSEAVEEMGIEFPNLTDVDCRLFKDPLFKNEIKNALIKINDQKDPGIYELPRPFPIFWNNKEQYIFQSSSENLFDRRASRRTPGELPERLIPS